MINNKIIYYRDVDGKVKGKFVNCDTKSSYFMGMQRIEKSIKDSVLDKEFVDYQKESCVEANIGAD